MKFLILLLSVTLASCDSPQNHRIIGSSQGEEKSSFTQKTFENHPLKVEFKWISGPHGSLSQSSSLMILIYNKDGQLAPLPEGLEPYFYGTMPAMGHPLEDPGFFNKLETGIYINESIQFNMEGEWKLELWLMNEEFNIKDKVQWLDQL